MVVARIRGHHPTACAVQCLELWLTDCAAPLQPLEDVGKMSVTDVA